MDPFRNGAAGVVISANLFRPEDFAELTTPSAPPAVASQLLIDAAATPPLRGGEYSARVRSIHTCNENTVVSPLDPVSARIFIVHFEQRLMRVFIDHPTALSMRSQGREGYLRGDL